jgi:DNA repair photolyase
MDWCLNPYVGCGHACVYCYASFMKRFTGHEEEWGAFVEAKQDVAGALARQVRRPRRGVVMVATVTDAYQAAERDVRATRACLEVLASTGMTVSILTKSDLVTRDIDVLRSFADILGEPRVRVGFSISTLDDGLAARLEPCAPPPSRRIAALAALAEAGVPTWVFVAPVIPGLTDAPESVAAVARSARQRGAAEVQVDPLNFYPTAVSRLLRLVRGLPAEQAFRAAAAVPAAWRERTARVLEEVVAL